MILQPEHEHEQTPPKLEKKPTPTKAVKEVPPPQPPPPPPSPPLVEQAPTPPQTPDILTKMLENSLTLILESAVPQIRQKMKYMEQKVHFSFSDGPNDYLTHLRGKRKPKTQQLVKQMIEIENWLAADNIWGGRTRLYERGELSSLKGQISGKLADMKRSMMSLSSIDKKASSVIENLLQFKKRNYWKHETETKKNVRNFLGNMKRIQSEQKKRYEQDLVKHQNQINLSLEQQKRKDQQTRRSIHSKELQKQLLWRKERQRISDQDRRKKQNIQVMLQKYRVEKPIHVKLQEQYIKNILEPLEEERQRKLEDIKKAHQPIEQEELEEHLQKYQEYKDNLMEEHRKKDQQFQDINSQLELNLKELYHSKFHQGMEPRFYNSVKVGQEQAKKKLREYSTSVFEKHKPKIDPAKRQKIKSTIRDLQLRQDKSKLMIKQEDGSFIMQEKPSFNGYRLGVQYLQQMKEDNQGKPRKKDRSASMFEMPPPVKRIDYLRESKPKVQLQKKTIGEWKKVVGDSSFSPRQKYEFIMQQAAVMQQKSLMKEAQMRSYKKGEKAIQLKNQMDKYYAESVAAKMVVLKDVIMKQ